MSHPLDQSLYIARLLRNGHGSKAFRAALASTRPFQPHLFGTGTALAVEYLGIGNRSRGRVVLCCIRQTRTRQTRTRLGAHAWGKGDPSRARVLDVPLMLDVLS